MYMTIHDIVLGNLHLKSVAVGGTLTMQWTENGKLHRHDDRP